ncbi:MAG: DUF2497 domain-containing protein [Acetobacteraceae bacterium]|nr:DUF2497 domain-containing protein [Acetobacteraceae bacterium]
MSTPSNPQQPPGGDPSMEDILASIRRILSEDDPSDETPRHDEPEVGEKDVLVLDPSMLVHEPKPEPTADHEINAEHDMNQEVETGPEPSPGATSPARRPDRELVAPETAAATASSVGQLVRTLTERTAQVHPGGPTIEDVVRDEIRPILKEWLDVNLPPLVERLVRTEIERVVGRAVP